VKASNSRLPDYLTRSIHGVMDWFADWSDGHGLHVWAGQQDLL